MNEEEEVNATSGAGTSDPEFATPEKQQARAFLRERFLLVIRGIVGKQAEFHLHENTHVSGEFGGCNVDYSEILVKNLETPIGKVPAAILRGSDLLYFDIDDIDVEQ